ncbi:MAG TPA: ADOP family duplicated permease [Hyphomicrobiales bacterium]|nr:ADOP family duplicated permease [Hyphomicrobiales bacterium]
MNDLLHDIAFAWRNALKRPATSLLIVATLALGIGVNTAMFSAAWPVLLAPLPYADGERLVKLDQAELAEDIPDSWWSVPTFLDIAAQSTVFSDLLEYSRQRYTLNGPAGPDLLSAGVVNWNWFTVLGVAPLVGRGFVNDDAQQGAPPIMLLGYGYWRDRFAGNANVIGTALEMNGIAYTIVGVLPSGAPYPHANDIWLPRAGDKWGREANVTEGRKVRWISHVVGRLRPGITLEAARQDLATVAGRLAREYPEVYDADYTVNVRPLRDDMAGEAATTLGLLLGLAFLVVLVASANVANLNLAAMAARSQELAVREAVGANPARIARQLLTESVAQALCAGVLAFLLAYVCLGLLRSFAAGYTPLASGIRLDGAVLLFTLLLSLVAGILSGVTAALGTRDINKALKEGGDKVTTSGAGRRRRNALMLLQFTAAFAMLSTAMLMLLSLYRLGTQDAGYDPAQVLVMTTELSPAYFEGDDPYTGQEPLRLLDAITPLPGVKAAALHAGNPLLQGSLYGFQPEVIEMGNTLPGEPTRVAAEVNLATENLFDVLGIPLLEGRIFTRADDRQAPQVAMVNERFQRSYFPNGAIGRTLQLGPVPATIVGVVANIRATDLREEEGEAIYINYRQSPSSLINLYVKSTGDLGALEQAIATLVRDTEPRLSTGRIAPLTALKSEWLAPARLRTLLVSLFGLLALTLTLSGVIGVVAWNVARRSREIGIHMALGASPADVSRLFMKDVLKIHGAGLLLGLVLMLAFAPLLEPLLFQAAAGRAEIYVASALILTLAVLVAVGLPLARVRSMSPMVALHVE